MSEFRIPDEIEGAGGPLLNPARDLCARHAEPLRAAWPKGAIIATVLLFDAFTRDERTQRMAGFDGTPGTGDPARLPALLAECSPLCCFVGDPEATEIIAEALAGGGPLIEAHKARQAQMRKERGR